MNSSDNNLLVVRVFHADEVTDRISSVTFNGDIVKKAKSIQGIYNRESLYYLAGADSGTYNLVVSFSTSGSFGGTICNYSGVDPVSPLSNVKSVVSNPVTTVSLTLKATTTAWVIGGAHNNAGPFSSPSNLSIVNGTSNVIVDSNGVASAASTTYSLNLPSPADGVVILGIFKEYAPAVVANYCIYANIHDMNSTIGQTCVTSGATTTCEYDNSTTTTPVVVVSSDIIFALALILFFVSMFFVAFVFNPFKKV